MPLLCTQIETNAHGELLLKFSKDSLDLMMYFQDSNLTSILSLRQLIN